MRLGLERQLTRRAYFAAQLLAEESDDCLIDLLMPAQISIQSVGLLLATLLCLVMIGVAKQRRASASGSALIALMWAAAIWDGAGALGASTVDLGGKVFWAKVQYVGICSAPLLWLRF